MIREMELYQKDLLSVAQSDLAWEKLKDKRILITGARGMIGSFLIDVLMLRNKLYGDAITVYALGRNEREAQIRFRRYLRDGQVVFIKQDINEPLSCILGVDYIIHAASNTHPIAYAGDPIGTITTNVFGVHHLLNFAVENGVQKFMFLSSVEIYGQNRGDVDYFDETYCGYIDCNSLRAGYPESKRAGEALCNAFAHAHGIDIVIPRLSRVYGPTMLPQDSKAIAQFINKGIRGENVVLKSKGHQHYSFCYVADAVSGILAILLNGEPGEAYNVSGLESDLTLATLAEMIANISGVKVVYQSPNAQESAGYSKATKALLDISKMARLGWEPEFTMKEGLEHTFAILAHLYNSTVSS